MTTISWIAVDWGITHLRCWGMDATNQVVVHGQSDKGMRNLSRGDFEAALRDLVGDWSFADNGPVDILACGMVGSRQGWLEAPYRQAPCKPLDASFANSGTSRFHLFVIPGIKQEVPSADVMRGEETQIAGYLARDKDFDGVVCLPGSHTKWVRVSAEEIVSFQTAMTGELFAAISGHTVLRHSLATGEGWDDDLFIEAVDAGMAHPARFSSRLFTLRAECLLQGLCDGAVCSRLSGLLIGMELAATKPYWLGQRITIIGAPELSLLYERALREQGSMPELESGKEMTLNGLIAARQSMKG